MKTNRIVLIYAILISTVLSLGQAQSRPASQATGSVFIGVWRGQTDGLPAVVLNITNESGELSGAALFYLHERKTVNEPYISTPGIPEPVFKLRPSGRVLQFEISHRRAHPPRTLHDPPVRFRLTMTGPDRAELVLQPAENRAAGPALEMVRSNQ